MKFLEHEIPGSSSTSILNLIYQNPSKLEIFKQFYTDTKETMEGKEPIETPYHCKIPESCRAGLCDTPPHSWVGRCDTLSLTSCLFFSSVTFLVLTTKSKHKNKCILLKCCEYFCVHSHVICK